MSAEKRHGLYLDHRYYTARILPAASRRPATKPTELCANRLLLVAVSFCPGLVVLTRFSRELIFKIAGSLIGLGSRSDLTLILTAQVIDLGFVFFYLICIDSAETSNQQRRSELCSAAA